MRRVGKLHVPEFEMHGCDGNHLVIGRGVDIFLIRYLCRPMMRVVQVLRPNP